MSKQRKAIISTSPFLHDKATTPKIMMEVVYTLIPLVALSYYFFGLGALLVVVASILGCMVTEYVFSSGEKWKKLKDGSALITGILLGLCLPPGFPLWMAFLGGIVSIGMGKLIWGGLGQNVFNPALVGRAFLQAAFPAAITTWNAPTFGSGWFSLNGTNAALPFLQAENVDAMTSATPLSKMKFDHDFGSATDQALGIISGSLGETAGVLILLLGIYMIWRKIIHWRIPVAILSTVILFSGLFWLINPTIYPDPIFMLFTGGLMLGTMYMATDLVTSPITPKGQWIYGVGIAILVVTIRLWGGLPEGVMYAILIMNAVTPLVNKFTKIKPYGYK
ncbi:MAG: RnfABCDGE type electron transport complex subunit D [Bacteroidia bacterium]|nr:RnfABCDGE type electron transport complex subunit D [Bacteroidia bacterium]